METYHTVFLGLGSNDERASCHLSEAIAAIAALEGVIVEAVSPEYLTEPQEYTAQPWFRNRVARLAAAPGWEPVPLMRALLALESALGRVRSADPALRFGPRVIDIDMLLFDEVRSANPVCLLPHPRMAGRAFVLVPLLDLAPDVAIGGVPARDLLARLPWRREGRKLFQ